MDDFFTSFKDNLEQRPELPPREGGWKDMERRLDAADGKHRSGGVAWWLPLLLLLLIGSMASNYWFYRQVRNSQEAAPRAGIISHASDTVYLTKVIYQTDTVFNTQVIRETTRIERPSAVVAANTSTSRNWPLHNISQLEQRFQRPLSSWTNSSELWEAKNADLSSPVIWSSANILAQQEERSQLNSAPIGILQQLDHFLKTLPAYKRKQPAAELVMVNAQKKKKTFSQYLYGMRPKSFSLGANGGWIYPIHSSVNNQAGFAAGIKAVVGFSDQVRFWGEASYMQLHYQTNSLERLEGIPPITPPGDPYDFVFANVPQPAMQYSFGLQYLFNPSKKWHPYLSAGLGSITLLPFEVTYDYEDRVNDLELELKQKLSRRTLFSTQALFTAGAELELSDRWSMQMEALYRLSLQDKGVTTSNMLGLRAGFLFHF